MSKRSSAFVAAALVATGVGHSYADSYGIQANNDDSFGRVDLGTGVFTKTGTSPVTYSDFGVSGGQLYSGAYLETAFYSINPANGAGTLITANDGITNFATGSTPAGVFELDLSLNLYKINLTTGDATLIGPTGLTRFGTDSVSNSFGNLYYTQDNSLYEINTTTGAGTLLGTLGVSNFEGMALIGGLGWGVTSAGQLATFTSSGSTTLGPVETGYTGTPYALAPETLLAI